MASKMAQLVAARHQAEDQYVPHFITITMTTATVCVYCASRVCVSFN